MKITFSKPLLPRSGTVVLMVQGNGKLSPSAKNLDKELKGLLSRTIRKSRFTGAAKQTMTLLSPAGSRLDRICLIGLGKGKKLDLTGIRETGGNVYALLAKTGVSDISVAIDKLDECDLSVRELAAEFGNGIRLRSYQFEKYKTKTKPENKPRLKSVRICCRDSSAAKSAFATFSKVADGVFLTRDLVSEPANVIYPESFAAQTKTLEKLGVSVQVLSEAAMRKLGMNALLGVGQGSERESRLVVMRWNGATGKARSNPPVAFVGKGVTFDTGGISIKPASGMEDMKWDMGGAGVVVGLMKALAGRKAKVNVVGVVGLAENMPSGAAQRPGDIVTSMSGQTIEVLNTDAEGRLVLADALWYCRDKFKPKLIVDLATLTGAIIVSLGHVHAGLFSNNDQLANRLSAAGDAVNEKLWRMPLGEDYDRMINSPVADMQNIGNNRGAGSITAAQFLKRFIGTTPWAHLDIAGVTWSKKGSSVAPHGGTGFGVRLLDRFVSNNYESK